MKTYKGCLIFDLYVCNNYSSVRQSLNTVTYIRYSCTSISCSWRTHTTCCIMASVLETKVDAQCDKLATEPS